MDSPFNHYQASTDGLVHSLLRSFTEGLDDWESTDDAVLNARMSVPARWFRICKFVDVADHLPVVIDDPGAGIKRQFPASHLDLIHFTDFSVVYQLVCATMNETDEGLSFYDILVAYLYFKECMVSHPSCDTGEVLLRLVPDDEVGMDYIPELPGLEFPIGQPFAKVKMSRLELKLAENDWPEGFIGGTVAVVYSYGHQHKYVFDVPMVLSICGSYVYGGEDIRAIYSGRYLLQTNDFDERARRTVYRDLFVDHVTEVCGMHISGAARRSRRRFYEEVGPKASNLLI